ncbi:unnamed protein product [Vicia faba]|uniref:Uncharacterized protein n=1 Tax=Vicia faba TaxID=3906 RepID=A0AAV0YHL2_VICFA|nr:unnamed protein product [Vicia faba]
MLPQSLTTTYFTTVSLRNSPNMLYDLVETVACCFQKGCYSFGYVIKDSDNNVALTSCKREIVHVTPGLEETLVFRWGLQLANLSISIEFLFILMLCLSWIA